MHFQEKHCWALMWTSFVKINGNITANGKRYGFQGKMISVLLAFLPGQSFYNHICHQLFFLLVCFVCLLNKHSKIDLVVKKLSTISLILRGGFFDLQIKTFSKDLLRSRRMADGSVGGILSSVQYSICFRCLKGWCYPSHIFSNDFSVLWLMWV